MFDALLTWHTALVVTAVYVSVTAVKTALAAHNPKLRYSDLTKKLVLPLLATLLGVAIGYFVHPPEVSSVSEIILYGAVVGYCSSALWRHLVGLVPALKQVDERLSSRPVENSVNDRETIPGPPPTIDSDIPREEQRLP